MWQRSATRSLILRRAWQPASCDQRARRLSNSRQTVRRARHRQTLCGCETERDRPIHCMPTAWGFLYVSPEKSISSRNTSDRTTLYISPPPAQSALAEPEGEARAAARLRQRLAVGAWSRRPPARSAAPPRRHRGRAAAPRRRPPTSTWWRARARRRWGARRGTRRALARSAISTGTHVSARFARNHGAGGRGAGGGAGGAGRRKSARMGGG